MSLYLSIKRRINKLRRILLRQREVRIHGITVLVDLIRPHRAIKGIDRRSYEQPEAVLVKEYIAPGSTVVELGASLGVISSVIGKSAPARLLCVEALPELAVAARRMLARNCPEVTHKVIQCAIAPTDGLTRFEYTQAECLSGRAAGFGPKQPHTVQLRAKRLSTLLAEEGIDGPFFLVSDIEGMEAALLLDDPGAFARCVGIIMEAHRTEYQGRKFSPDEIFSLCESLGFKLIKRLANVAYLKRIAA